MKQKKTILTIALLFAVFSSSAQNTLQLEPIALNKLVAFEKALGSESKGMPFFNPYYDEDFEDLVDEHPNVQKKTMIFKRSYDPFYPTLHSWYFFDSDSVVRLVYYNWGFANTSIENSDEELRLQRFRKGDFAQKYVDEKALLIAKLGKPSVEDQKESNSSYLNLTTIWDHPDKRVVLEMTAERQIVEFSNSAIDAHRVTPRSKVIIKVLMKR